MSKPVKSKPHRVLMLIENAPFPADRRMRHLAETLHGAGYEVSVICQTGDDCNRYFEIIGGVKVYRYPVFFHAKNSLGYLFEYPWSLLCLGVLSLFVWIRNGVDI